MFRVNYEAGAGRTPYQGNDVLPLAEGSSVTLPGNNTVNPFYGYHGPKAGEDSTSMHDLVTYVDAMPAAYEVNAAVIDAYNASGVV